MAKSVRRANASEIIPGPADYNPDTLRRQAPSYLIAKSPRKLSERKEIEKQNGPGPGFYNPV
jgi:hypothetical protein